MKRILLVAAVLTLASLGCKSVFEEDDEARIHPIAVIEASGEDGCAPYTVIFDGGKSFTESGRITSYWWIYGDGAEGAGKVATHAFASPGTYDVMLVVTNSFDLAGQAVVRVTVRAAGANLPPAADIVINGPSSGDAPFEASFDATGSSDPDGSIADYAWDFGDGNTGTGPAPAHTYTSGGDFTVTLVVTDDGGATDSTTTPISVTGGKPNVLPEAVAEADPETGTAPLEVMLSGSKSRDTDGSIVSYQWDFGDGDNGSGVTVAHTYAAGNYTATLTVTDNAGGTDAATVDVSVNASPTAAISASPLTGDEPLTVLFDASGSADSDGSIVSYQWNFGDGYSGSGTTPGHLYASAGQYTAMLVVTDDDGATGSALISITVTGAPNQLPTALIDAGPLSGTSPLTVSFSGSGSSDPDGYIDTWDWDFGDSASDSGENVSHAYAAGNHTATLTVTDDGGGTDTATVDIFVNARPVAAISANPTSGPATLSVDFDGSGSTDSDGSVTGYTWYFGDGATATGASPSHDYTAAGTYTATLVVTDDFGASGTTSITITVTGGTNQPPTAVIDADPVSGTAPLDVSYSAASSSDSDGSIVSYDWDFGDGSNDTGASTSHIYAPGSYTATLTVTDNGGLTDTAVIDIFVNEAPTAAISANPSSGEAPLAVNFSGSGSSDGDGSIVSYSWDFGDGATATGVSPSHEYVAEGSYTVTLTVTDDFGATNTDTTTITASGPAPNEAPVAVAVADPTTGSAPLLVDFDGSGSYDSDGSIVSYEWDFGDGATGTGAIASHTYSAAGTYIATLTVTDDLDAESNVTVSINASGDGPEAVIQANVYHGIENLTVNFNGTGSTAGGATIDEFDWDFGDGGSSSSASPSHTFSAGVYWVTLTITDSLGRTGQAQTVIAVATWEEEVVRLTNIERWTADGGANLPPLKKESHIDDAALRHSTDMAVNEHFSHTGTDGSSVGDRMTDAGYIWYTCGENIAAGYTSPAAVVQGWMDSPGHHANIMRTTFREIGVSYVYDGSTYYRHWWTQDFGARSNIYPVVIEREEFATASSTVDLYIYGSGWASQMMVSNSATFAGASWEAFASDKTWALEPGLGTKTVYVKLKSGATERTYSDSIVVVEQ